MRRLLLRYCWTIETLYIVYDALDAAGWFAALLGTYDAGRRVAYRAIVYADAPTSIFSLDAKRR